jgi:hypothetical protein
VIVRQVPESRTGLIRVLLLHLVRVLLSRLVQVLLLRLVQVLLLKGPSLGGLVWQQSTSSGWEPALSRPGPPGRRRNSCHTSSALMSGATPPDWQA